MNPPSFITEHPGPNSWFVVPPSGDAYISTPCSITSTPPLGFSEYTFLVGDHLVVILLAHLYNNASLERMVDWCYNLDDTSKYARVDIPAAGAMSCPVEVHLHATKIGPCYTAKKRRVYGVYCGEV